MNGITSKNVSGIFVYVIRWQNRIDGEEDSGNFEVCYANEADACKAMVEDYESTLCEWSKRIPEGKKAELSTSNTDFRAITFPFDTYDYHNWYIDKLEVQN